MPANGAPQQNLASIAPDAAGSIAVAYRLRFWFIPFGETSYRAVFDGGKYEARSHFRTSGLVSVFWQSTIDASASGRIEPHGVTPSLYDSYAKRSSDKVQEVKLTYPGDGPPQLLAKPAYDTKRYPVPVAEQETGVDPMSAITLILGGLTADKANPCGTVAPVFDGRRRYDVELVYVQDETVKLDSRIYEGPAHLCTIRYHEIAGYKQEILKKGSGWPSIYALVADVPDPGAPLGRYTVPVKLWADTSYGKVSAEITRLKTGWDEVKG
jgi:hypothetical protein